MSYLPNKISEKIHSSFLENNLSVDVRNNHMVVLNSQDQTEERIGEIVKSAGFCPLISKNKIHGNFALTIVPFKTPNFFTEMNQSEAPEITSNNEVQHSVQSQLHIHPFSFSEISSLLVETAFTSKASSKSNDKWASINTFRKYVAPSISEGLHQILYPKTKEGETIVEIGSGIGYNLPVTLASKTVRIQPCINECQLLKPSISGKVYQLDVEGLCDRLVGKGKTVPLFFALNVFDTMSPEIRKASLLQLSQLQKSGDSIVMMLDTNPYLGPIIEHFESLCPDHVIFPYFPLNDNCVKLSAIAVPKESVSYKPSLGDFAGMIKRESMNLIHGNLSWSQLQLHELHKKLNLKVMSLEDLFTEQVKCELNETGYDSNVYYHTTFTIGSLPDDISGIKQDLIYKSVTDTATVREWDVGDAKLRSRLSEKGINLPEKFDKACLKKIRENGEKIFGAEFLVIEATKR